MQWCRLLQVLGDFSFLFSFERKANMDTIKPIFSGMYILSDIIFIFMMGSHAGSAWLWACQKSILDEDTYQEIFGFTNFSEIAHMKENL